MLFLVFSLNDDRYALAGRDLLEVLPLSSLKQIPKTPPGIAGVLDYHGVLLPVIDLSAMTLGRPSAPRLSTRLLVAEGEDGRRIALIAEQVSQMIYREPADFTDSTVAVEGAPYLGPVTRDERGLIQWIKAEKMLSPEVREALYATVAEAA